MHIRPSLTTLNEPTRPKEHTEARSFNRDPLLIAHASPQGSVGCAPYFFEIKAELERAHACALKIQLENPHLLVPLNYFKNLSIKRMYSDIYLLERKSFSEFFNRLKRTDLK